MQPLHVDGHLGHFHPRQRLYPLGDMTTHLAALGTDVGGVAEFEAEPDPGAVRRGAVRPPEPDAWRRTTTVACGGTASAGGGGSASRAARDAIFATTRSAIRVAPRSGGGTIVRPGPVSPSRSA